MPRIIKVRGLREAAEAMARSFVPAGELRDLLRRRGLIVKLEPGGEPEAFAAVDSAFPKSPVYLVGGSFSLVAVAAVLVRGRVLSKSVRSWLVVEEQGELDQDYVAAYARLMERRAMLGLLSGGELRALIVDGELVPRKGRSPLWEEVVRLSKDIVSSSARRGLCLAGVLKRSYSRTVSARLGLNISDRVLASAALRRGEAIIVPHGGVLEGRGCFEALYKPSRGLPVAVRVELCCRDPVGLVSWLAYSAGPSGFPWLVDLVDSLAKQEAAKVSALESLLLSKLARRELHHYGYSANPQETMRRQRGQQS